MPWIVVGLLVALACGVVLRIARRTGHQLLASVALWGIWVGLAVTAMGLAAVMLTAMCARPAR